MRKTPRMSVRSLVLPLFTLLVIGLRAQQVHVLEKGALHRPAGKAMEVLSVPHDTMSPEEALRASGYTRSAQDVINLHISGDDHWLRTRLGNATGTDKLVVFIPYWEIDELDAYAWNGRELVALAHIGQSVSAGDRLGAYPEMAFDVDLPTVGSTTLLIRVRSVKQLQLPVTFTTRDHILGERGNRNLLSGSYLGLMVFLVLYNFFVFLSMRDRGYLHYVLYILTLCLAQLTLHGIGQAHMWPGMPRFAASASVIFTLASMLFAGSFTRRFLGLPTLLPRIDRILMGAMALIGITLLVHLFHSRALGYQLAHALTGPYSLLLIVVAIMSIRSGSRAARFFLVAWGFFLAGVVIYILRDVGVLPWNDLTTYSIPLGSAIEGVLLSFGLADRINILRREKERSQADTLRALQENERLVQEQNQLLERKVRERTEELQESNDTLKRTQAQLVSSEKMASLGQLTAGIAHEINNPINFISSNVPPLRRNMQDLLEVLQHYQRLKAEDGPEVLADVRALEKRLDLATTLEEMEGIIESIAEGSSRTAEIVRGLRHFSRLDEHDLKEADLNEGIRSTLAVLAPQHRDKVTVQLDLQQLPSVECYPGKLNQVFMNIITNGIQAAVARTGEHERVLRVRTHCSGNEVHVTFSDNGVGMSREVMDRIYDPFFTTKPVGEGTGLGMAIVYGILQEHNASISLESTPGLGTTFQLRIPLRHRREQPGVAA